MSDRKVCIEYEASATWGQSIKVRLLAIILNFNSLRYASIGYFEMIRQGGRAC